MERQVIKLSGLKEGYLVEYNGDNPMELSQVLTKYLNSYGDLLQGHTLFIRSGLDDRDLAVVQRVLSDQGFANRLVAYKPGSDSGTQKPIRGVGQREQRREKAFGFQGKMLFHIVAGPMRGGENINSNEGVLLWGDLHKDALIKAPCVIVMGKAEGRVVVPEGAFVLFRQSEGASVQVGNVLYVDISSRTWILITDSEPNAIEVFQDEKQAGRRISEWLGNA
jgi:hypothetical protein